MNESAQSVVSALVAGKLDHLSPPVWKRGKGKGVLIGGSKAALSEGPSQRLCGARFESLLCQALRVAFPFKVLSLVLWYNTGSSDLLFPSFPNVH